MTTYFVNLDDKELQFEVDGHFFGQEGSVLGNLFLVKNSSVIASFRKFNYFTIDPATLPAPVVQPVSEAA